MENKLLYKNIMTAAKWSSLTQVIAKLIVPLSNMILARILAPEAFGVIGTIIMIISFVEMFSDAGFQKFLIQHDFEDEKEKVKFANVAFWTNFTLATILWSLIILFRDLIAVLVGNPGLGIVIAISCIQLPLSAFSSIQLALFNRDLDFKSIFTVRVVSILIPFFITVPLAFMGFDYWSLIIGMIAMQLFNAIFLTLKSNWRPQFYFEFNILKRMFSFSMWSMIEAISIWLTAWIDVFIIGYYLNEYYLGIYKTSTIMVSSLFALITAATTPILFSGLSKLQKDEENFKKVFYKFQRLVSVFVFPLGIGIFLYRDLVTHVLLGDQWSEASDVVGIWALSSAIIIVFGHFCSEVYRAKGLPKLSFLAQFLHLVVLTPVCLISIQYGFWVLVVARAFTRLQFVFVHLLIMHFIMKIKIIKSFKNVNVSSGAAVFVGLIGYFLKEINSSRTWEIITILMCIIIYLFILFMSKRTRIELLSVLDRVLPIKFQFYKVRKN